MFQAMSGPVDKTSPNTVSLRENFWSVAGQLSVRQKFSPGQRENLQDRQILVSIDNNLALENIFLVLRLYWFTAFLPKNVNEFF